MIRPPSASDSIRRKIETLGTSLSLPTVSKALGMLEGDHASGLRRGSDDVMDIRPYDVGDESRLIDWKTSARAGRPMVVQRERLMTSRAWLILDVGMQMQASCASGELAYEVAGNALRMFAMLSLRRSDDVSLVFGDAASISRVPFHGGIPEFERTLDIALRRQWNERRNIEALLRYACAIRERNAMIVLATDEHSLGEHHLTLIRRIARTHPLVLINVETLNPFARRNAAPVLNGLSERRVPSFFIDPQAERDVATHRAYVAAALERELHRSSSTVIRSDSSEGMFTQFVRMITMSMASSGRNHLRASTPLALPARLGGNA